MQRIDADLMTWAEGYHAGQITRNLVRAAVPGRPGPSP